MIFKKKRSQTSYQIHIHTAERIHKELQKRKKADRQSMTQIVNDILAKALFEAENKP